MAEPIVYWCAVAESITVVIGATDILPALKKRVTDAGELEAFSDTEPLQALEAITKRQPRLVVLERLFATTPRGAALINRIKADPSLAQTEIRVLSHDSEYSRVLPRNAGPGGPPSTPAAAPTTVVQNPVAAATRVEPAAFAATIEREQLDPTGTRRAPRFKIAGKVEILVDGNAATLVELSTSGAQVLSPTVLKPNQRVRMALTDEAGIVRFNATIAWARFEIPPGSGPQYRAGIEFTDADSSLVDAFCARHKA
jgi:PilZ domain-containing protein